MVYIDICADQHHHSQLNTIPIASWFHTFIDSTSIFSLKNSPTGKLTWQSKMTIFNGRYIVKWLVFQSVMLAVLRGLLPRQSFGQTPVPGVTLTLHIGVGFGPLKLLQLGHVNAGQKASEDGSKSTGIWWFCMALRWVYSIYIYLEKIGVKIKKSTLL